MQADAIISNLKDLQDLLTALKPFSKDFLLSADYAALCTEAVCEKQLRVFNLCFQHIFADPAEGYALSELTNTDMDELQKLCNEQISSSTEDRLLHSLLSRITAM